MSESPNTARRRAGLPPYPTDTAATEATQPDTFPGRLAALHEQILRNLIEGVEEIKDHALRAARTGQSDLVLSTDVEITEGQPETCTATLSGAPIAGSLHRCSAPAGHYDETRRPTARGEERDTGGWHYTTPSETGDQVVWADHADGATPHETRCPGCGHTDGEGCGCPTPPFTTLEVHEDETPAVLRELTAAVRELVTVMREDLDGRTEDAEATDFEPATPATTCSAYRRIAFEAEPRQCIRAAHHHGDHIDEHGFHWSDTLAVDPVVKMISHDGPATVQPFEQRLPDWLAAGTRDLSIPEQSPAEQPRCVCCGSTEVRYRNYREQPFCWPCANGEQRPTLRERHRAAWQTLTPAEQEARLDALDTDDREQSPAAERPRCPDCQMPHDLTPGSLPMRACASIRARIAAEDQEKTLGTVPWSDGMTDLYGKPHPADDEDEPAADAPDVVHSEANPQASGSPGVDDPWKAKAEEAEAGRDRIRQEYEKLLTRWRNAQITVDRVRALVVETMQATKAGANDHDIGRYDTALVVLDLLKETEPPAQQADQIRAYIDTALFEGYWKHLDQHNDRLRTDLAEWTPVGVLGSIEGLNDSQEDPAAPAFAWPHLHDKTAFPARLEISIPYTRGPFDEALNALDVIYRARLDRRLARLARALGQWEEIVRRDFHAVQQVLEDAGVLDGYGRLTIPQPVRTPVIWGPS